MPKVVATDKMPDPVFGVGAPPSFNHKASDFFAFKERLLQFFVANGITDQDRKRAILIGCVDEETYVLVRNICFPEKPMEKSFENLLRTIQEHLSPVRSYFTARGKFFSARRYQEESVPAW